MEFPSLTLVSEIEKRIDLLIKLESQREKTAKKLSESEDKFFSLKESQEQFLKDYSTEKENTSEFKSLRELDKQIMQENQKLIECFNKLNICLDSNPFEFNFSFNKNFLDEVMLWFNGVKSKKQIEEKKEEKEIIKAGKKQIVEIIQKEAEPIQIPIAPEKAIEMVTPNKTELKEKEKKVINLIKETEKVIETNTKKIPIVEKQIKLEPEMQKAVEEKISAKKTNEKIIEKEKVINKINEKTKNELPEFIQQIGSFFSEKKKPVIIEEPEIETDKEELERKFTEQVGEKFNTLIKGNAFAQVEKKDGQEIYSVIEPSLSQKEKNEILEIKDKLIDRISLESTSKEKLFKEFNDIVKKLGYVLGEDQTEKYQYYLTRNLFGLGKIEPLMHDTLIEDIECNGPEMPVFIVHRKLGHIPTNIKFKSIDELREFIIKLSQISKGYVSFASPILDAILPDGSRVNAILTESVSTKGPTFTIRKFPERPFSPTDLLRFGTVDSELLAFLWTAVEFKRNILIVGPTAAGKTTLLNSLAMFIPSGNRVVSIEDTRELNIVHENWLPQISRKGFGPPDVGGKKYGEVNLSDLIKESFRERPDYLIVGEIRGEEAFVMFQGMSSGHTTISTMHAKRAEDVVNRLITPPINLHPSLLNSLDLIICLSFVGLEVSARRIREIDEIKGYNTVTSQLEYEKVFEWTPGMTEEKTKMDKTMNEVIPLTYRSITLKKISSDFGIDLKKIQDMISERAKFLDKMAGEGITDYAQFSIKLREFRKHEAI